MWNPDLLEPTSLSGNRSLKLDATCQELEPWSYGLRKDLPQNMRIKRQALKSWNIKPWNLTSFKNLTSRCIFFLNGSVPKTRSGHTPHMGVPDMWFPQGPLRTITQRNHGNQTRIRVPWNLFLSTPELQSWWGKRKENKKLKKKTRSSILNIKVLRFSGLCPHFLCHFHRLPQLSKKHLASKAQQDRMV